MITLFVNPNGVLCYTFDNKGKSYLTDRTIIDVKPIFDGLACDGVTIINMDDWHYVSHRESAKTVS